MTPTDKTHHQQEATEVLRELSITPILADVGASGAAPEVWQPLADQSVYLGFDPDLREIRNESGGIFKQSFVLNEAVCPDDSQHSVTFHLTRSPFCSSTLPPDREGLSNYIFAPWFDVQRTTQARATTLNRALHRVGLDRIDWLKVDTQGTDLRIFKSLPEQARPLAIDIEPGLIPAYEGEDTFTQVHTDLTQQGYWLSDMRVCGSVRINRDTAKDLMQRNPGMDVDGIGNSVRKSPGWVEARYLRSVDALAPHRETTRDHALLWAFAMIDGQCGFALDVARAVADRPGDQKLGLELNTIATDAIQRSHAQHARATNRQRQFRRLRRVVGRVLPMHKAA
ncbi:MAG: hypothetical protein GC164_09460 [Phycisphaera sp.]|nr:hypothetical protein [Phycisphaera sp.]